MIKNHLEYNPETGSFIWIKATSNRAKEGSVAGATSGNYLYVQFNKEKIYLHRLAWYFVYGYMPTAIDHINQDCVDNRICNLRNVSQAENRKNSSMPSNNTSGVMGVCWSEARNQWEAKINVNKKKVFLGRFTKFSEAVDARKNAEVLYGFHKNHGRKKK